VLDILTAFISDKLKENNNTQRKTSENILNNIKNDVQAAIILFSLYVR
jgi:hypothetical protein